MNKVLTYGLALLVAVLSVCGKANGRTLAAGAGDTAVFPFSFRMSAGADAPRVAGRPDAWAGGLNAAHIAVLDLNGDGQDDLLVFDRNGKLPLCFLYDEAMGAADAAGASGCPYVYAPACAAGLPPLREWVQACDYNGDGRPDLFTFNGVAGISVYRNVSAWETDALGGAVYRLRFELQTPRLQAKMYGQYGDLYCTGVDYPALVDIDGDGAVDVLNFWVPSTGDYLHYYRNYALETYGTRDSFDLRIEDWSWGCFAENEESNGIYLDSCRPSGDGIYTESAAKGRDAKHSGSTIGVLPRETAAGRVYDLLLGDVGFDGLMYLHNGGTPALARITAYDSLFPAADPVRLRSMPVVSVLPAGVAAAMGWEAATAHICVSPYNTDVFSTQGSGSLWVYALSATPAGDAASGGARQPFAAARQTTGFLQAGMIDHGALSCPTLFDYNGDGLPDIVAGYGGDPASDGEAARGGLALYENVGTPTAPAFRFVTDDYLGLRRGGLQARALSPAFGDYDGDGTPELVLGTYEGRLLAYTLRYEGAGAAEAVLRDSLFLGLQTSGSTAPALFDLDGDGLLDLIVGCRQQLFTDAAGRRYTRSSLIYYHHAGVVDAATGHPFEKLTDSLGGVEAIDRTFSNYGYARPAFYRPPQPATGRAAAYLLCGAENGRLKAYAFDGRRWQDTFAAAGYLPWWLTDSTASQVFVGEHSAPVLADLDGDGHPDLVVGNARGGLHFARGMAYRPSAPDSSDWPPVATEIPELEDVNVYPNPSGGLFKLELPVAATVEVFAANGLLCRRLTLGAGISTLNISSKGLYLLRITAGGRTAVKRVVVR